jgi:hypothetical protein
MGTVMSHRPQSVFGLLGAVALIVAGSGTVAGEPTAHPRLFVAAEPALGVRSLADLKADIRHGHAGTLWARLKALADADLHTPVLVPSSPVPGRDPDYIRHGNRDFELCHAVGQRVLRAALANLLTGEAAYLDSALRQTEALFDPARWPDWRDVSHVRFAADLRTGQLSRDLAVAYDWLHPALTPGQREALVAGIDRRGIRPFWKAVDEKAYWVDRANNWMTCIVGGMGIAGMALGDDHPDSRRLVEFAVPRMEKYLEMYGPDGEFNESPGYAGATSHAVRYFAARRSWSGGRDDRLGGRPFPQACLWQMYLTLPPGRCAAFGDTHAEEPPGVFHVPAVAAAAGDGVLQWFYLENPPAEPDVYELVWFDPRLAPIDPQGRLPPGRAFPAHGGCVVSRTDWKPRETACVVYGKVGHESHHADNDAGQVCVDGYARRLILDPGMPSMYPPDYYRANRTNYYNGSARGHNVLVCGGREPRTEAGGARFVATRFDADRGGAWTQDLTPLYENAEKVHRAVVHRFPGVVAVLDEANLSRPEEISLRWHTANRCTPDAEGRFLVESEGVQLAARVVALDGGAIETVRGEHAHRPPFDRNRVGEPLVQRRESYVEVTRTAASCRLLTVFAVLPRGAAAATWEPEDGGWTIATGDGRFTVCVGADSLSIRHDDEAEAWSMALPGTAATAFGRVEPSRSN